MRKFIGPLIGALAVMLGAFLLHRTLSLYQWTEIAEAVAVIPSRSIAGGIVFAGASYFCLTWFDWLALRYVGHPQPYRRAALASFTSLSIGHNVGFAGLSSGTIRYRFYSRWGLGLADVAKLVLFCGLTVVLGLATIGGVALVINPGFASKIVGIDEFFSVVTGSGLIAAVLIYLVLSVVISQPLRIHRWTLDVPPLRLATAQVAIGSINFLCIAACLHQMISAASNVGYFDVAAAYVVSNVAVLLSHVPGGVGVIESVLTALLPGVQMIGVLVMFRVVYFLLPLCLGLPLFGLSELLLRQKKPVTNASV